MIKATLFQEVLSDMEAGVFDFTENGECSSCGSCCSNFLPISKSEIKAIQDYIEKNKIKEQRHVVPLATPYIDFTCPFRNNTDRKCEIYAVRPTICRDFKCDKPRKHIEADRAMYQGRYFLTNVRATFYGKEQGK